MMKSLTKKALHRVGCDIKKRYSCERLENISPMPSSGIILEFIGPSGIGKTTFFDKIKGEYRKGWLYRDDIKCVNGLDEAYWLLSSNEEKAISRIMHLAYLRILNEGFRLPVKDRIYNYLVKEMKADILFRKHCFGKGVISEDGLLHNFCSTILEARNEADQDIISEINMLFRNRCIVNFKASDEHIMKNLEKRKKERPGAGNDWIGNLGVEQTRKIIASYKSDNEKLIKLALSLGARVQDIDAEANYENNKIIFKSFVDETVEEAFRHPEKNTRRGSSASSKHSQIFNL